MEKFSKINISKRRRREPDNDDVAHNSPDKKKTMKKHKLPTMIVGLMIVKMMIGKRKKKKWENSGVYMLVVYGVWKNLHPPLSILEANYRIFPFLRPG